MKIDKGNIKWIVLLLSIILISVMYSSLILRVLVQHGVALIGLIGATTIVYYFFSDVIFGVVCGVGKWKRCWSCVFTAIVLSVCIYFYVHDHSTSYVRMKEDVLYIHPRSSVQDEIYDGSENDPNMREDTTINK